jgi:hypothetical protein
LDEVKNDADMLDWILHVMMKDWGNEAVAGLVWGLAAHLHPERVYRRLR